MGGEGCGVSNNHRLMDAAVVSFAFSKLLEKTTTCVPTRKEMRLYPTTKKKKKKKNLSSVLTIITPFTFGNKEGGTILLFSFRGALKIGGNV